MGATGRAGLEVAGLLVVSAGAETGGGTGVDDAGAMLSLPGSGAPTAGAGDVAVACAAGAAVWEAAEASAAGLSSAKTEESATHRPSNTSAWRVAWAG